MNVTNRERDRILDIERPRIECWVVTFVRRGYISQHAHRPDETRVSSVHKNMDLAEWAARRSGGEVVKLNYRPRRGDILAIHDGRDIARELGL